MDLLLRRTDNYRLIFAFLLFMFIKFIAAILFLMRKFSELLRDSMQKKMDVLIKPRAN